MGYQDVVVDSFLCTRTWENVPVTTWQKNIVVSLQGTISPSKVIVVGGHYDSATTPRDDPMNVAPGADDNGSGTGAVLEIARTLKQTGFKPQSTIRFVTFAAEEIGLFGSSNYAGKARASGMDIRLMINLDVISYSTEPLRGSVVRIMYCDSLTPEVTEAMRIASKFTVLSPKPERGCSDDYSFSSRGFPSVGFFEGRFSPYLHSAQDVLANHNMEYCAEVTRVACAVVATFADEPLQVANVQIARVNNTDEFLLKWSRNNSVAVKHYQVYLGRECGIYDMKFTTSDTTLVLENLDEEVRYFAGVTGVDQGNNEGPLTEISFVPGQVPLPTAFNLFQNYPNPFNTGTNIWFDIPTSTSVSLKVFDLMGREIAVLVDRKLDAGRHSVRWEAKNCASGVYFYRMHALRSHETKRLLIVR
jgi:hypothetical protein